MRAEDGINARQGLAGDEERTMEVKTRLASTTKRTKRLTTAIFSDRVKDFTMCDDQLDANVAQPT